MPKKPQSGSRQTREVPVYRKKKGSVKAKITYIEVEITSKVFVSGTLREIAGKAIDSGMIDQVFGSPRRPTNKK